LKINQALIQKIRSIEMTFKYGIDRLDLDIVNGIARGTIKAELCQGAIDNINTSRARVEKMAASDKAIYGINTGFGPLCDTQITPEQTNLLQKKFTDYPCCWCW
jgi:histidine ammonia-lyase